MQLFFNLNVKGLVAEQESGYGIIDIGFPNEKEKKMNILVFLIYVLLKIFIIHIL